MLILTRMISSPARTYRNQRNEPKRAFSHKFNHTLEEKEILKGYLARPTRTKAAHQYHKRKFGVYPPFLLRIVAWRLGGFSTTCPRQHCSRQARRQTQACQWTTRYPSSRGTEAKQTRKKHYCNSTACTAVFTQAHCYAEYCRRVCREITGVVPNYMLILVTMVQTRALWIAARVSVEAMSRKGITI